MDFSSKCQSLICYPIISTFGIMSFTSLYKVDEVGILLLGRKPLTMWERHCHFPSKPATLIFHSTSSEDDMGSANVSGSAVCLVALQELTALHPDSRFFSHQQEARWDGNSVLAHTKKWVLRTGQWWRKNLVYEWYPSVELPCKCGENAEMFTGYRCGLVLSFESLDLWASCILA
jgi:hypothetical protein